MTTERIDRCFAALKEQGRAALVAYLTIGDPDLDQCTECALAALNSGADLLELGVPFSDPTADGPVIAAASYRAIQRGGSLPAALSVAQRIRSHTNAPIVLFTYYNPVIAFGDERLPQAAVGAGIDGILVVDLPPEEGALLRSAAQRAELAVIPLVAPTTAADREARVLQGARGFVYYVSLTGITGAKSAPLEEAGRRAAELRGRAGLPVVVGFGIHTGEQAAQVVAQGVDGVVVGTAIVRAIAEAADLDTRLQRVRELCSSLRRGLDQGVAK